MAKLLLPTLLFFWITATPSRGDLQHPRTFPNFGISLARIPDWVEIFPNTPQRIVQWADIDKASGRAQAFIQLEGGTPSNPNAEAMAREVASDLGGVVAKERVLLDGTQAYHIVAEKRALTVLPAEAILAFHEQKVYTIIGSVVGGASCHDQIEAIRLGWKWIAFAPAATHLQLRDDPVLLRFGNASVAVRVPELMYKDTTDVPERECRLAIYDLPTNGTSFHAYIQIMRKVRGETFDVLKQRTAAEVTRDLKPDKAFAWREIPGASPRALTDVALVPVNDSIKCVAWALIDLDADSILVINFGFERDPERERPQFMNVAEVMVKSVTLRKDIEKK